jgi:RNA polymerase sigma-70 factor (ECF subfamily)
MDAFERHDLDAVAALLHEDLHSNMPPYPFWFRGREANVTAMSHGFDPASPGYLGEWRSLETAANRQAAAAFYVRAPGDTEFRAFAIDVLGIEDGKIAEITSFITDRFDPFPVFGLPATL